MYPDVSFRILYPERILTYSVRILCEPLYSVQDTLNTMYRDVSPSSKAKKGKGKKAAEAEAPQDAPRPKRARK